MPDSRKQVLRGLADNKELFEAVKEIIFEQFDLTLLDTSIPNEELGQHVRARLDGAAMVELAFRKIATCASAEKSTNKDNPAY